jgi:CubicO group peptidase (beta-lactamase class C family)
MVGPGQLGMKPRNLVIAALAVALLSSSAFASPAEVSAGPADLARTADCLQQGYHALADRHAIAAAVVDESSAKILLFGAASANQIFEIGSITKTFTATLLAQSVLSGRVRLSDPIPADYQKPGSVITYRQLTTHTSGITGALFPGYTPVNPMTPFDGLTIPLFKMLYARTPLASAPGTIWSYSNIATSLLGLILSEEAGRSYEDLVRERIFGALGMSDSYFEVPADASMRFPEGFMVDQDGKAQAVPHWDLYRTAIDPAGGIRSTIGDMIKYARAQLVPQSSALSSAIELSQQPLYAIHEPKMWIGMNWIVQPDQKLIWHNGETFGFNTIVAVSRTKGLSVVALTDTTVLKAAGSGGIEFDDSLQSIAFGCLAK